MYSVFVRLDNGELVFVGCREQLEDFIQLYRPSRISHAAALPCAPGRACVHQRFESLPFGTDMLQSTLASIDWMDA
jgi:hypothetical protein